MAVFTQRINANINDVEELDADKSGGSEGDMDLGSSDLEFNPSSDTTGSGYIGLRYTNVTIPQGATIDSAKIQFHVDEVLDNAALTVTWRGEAVDSAAEFTSTAFNLTDRAQTTASVDWVVPSWLAVNDEGSAQLSAELKTIVQEIVDRAGWASGNALVLMKLGWSGVGERTAESRDGEQAAAPELQITYSTDKSASGSPSITKLTSTGAASVLTVPIITDVNTTESWTDGDTGLVITGTDFI